MPEPQIEVILDDLRRAVTDLRMMVGTQPALFAADLTALIARHEGTAVTGTPLPGFTAPAPEAAPVAETGPLAGVVSIGDIPELVEHDLDADIDDDYDEDLEYLDDEPYVPPTRFAVTYTKDDDTEPLTFEQLTKIVRKAHPALEVQLGRLEEQSVVITGPTSGVVTYLVTEEGNIALSSLAGNRAMAGADNVKGIGVVRAEGVILPADAPEGAEA